MRQLFEILPQIAESSSTVLIEGPSGTGKELFARAIHTLSPRKRKRFVAVNCAALPDTLLESELFGHKAGAFTDAKRDKPGRFALADGGTIFLDEIGDISPAMQVRLLRVLQGTPGAGDRTRGWAGIQAAQAVAQLGAEAVLTGHVGPKAFATLEAGRIAIYPGAVATVRQVLEELRCGHLQPTTKANVEGHWV